MSTNARWPWGCHHFEPQYCDKCLMQLPRRHRMVAHALFQLHYAPRKWLERVTAPIRELQVRIEAHGRELICNQIPVEKRGQPWNDSLWRNPTEYFRRSHPQADEYL